ncbi:hypothetical protein ALQ68_200106 [Pseudomonas savastanoi pv. glycinea]|nr:hypothetical protein ALQ75_200150 [Pseudomonas savastanoi pv. glycinea]RMM87249.1 hypothetical protein ALQ68_200106 [Pseudomonas savastanoi pv. glycinea]RMV50287.1 hypothetical protein ALP09_200040 [Pseudomonas amygdali pv. lachrymans]
MRLKTDDFSGVYADALGLVHFLFHCSAPCTAITRFSPVAR